MTVAPSRTLRPSSAREALYREFRDRIAARLDLDRALVSFQANRGNPIYGWFKYKEGFSAQLVEILVRQSGRGPGVLLDPFAGAGTALLVGRSMGWDTIGIEVLPVGPVILEAWLAAERVTASSLKRRLELLARAEWFRRGHNSELCPRNGDALNHIPITACAFPSDTEGAIAAYRAYCRRHVKDPNVRTLMEFAGLAVLEAVSFTRKDGQYLRWDYRAGKERVKNRFDKGPIPDFRSAVLRQLERMYEDLAGTPKRQGSLHFSSAGRERTLGTLDLRIGSCLEVLPTIDGASVDLVITSPPYCNRYDYTRTYALELVYLGYSAAEVKALRQAMLSCTVENRTKVEELRALYDRVGRPHVFASVLEVFRRQKALQEVLGILDDLGQSHSLNNANVPKMVRNYFLEMAFVVQEVSRVLRPGANVFMVNDNVRYAGEEVPVDLILSDFAESFGLETVSIWSLPRGKGNSSQQMGRHGRAELRKCICHWRKAVPTR